MSSQIKTVNHTTREDWLASRSDTIGASESAILFGVGYGNKTPLSLWTDKSFGAQESDVDPMVLKLGHLIEPVIIELINDWLNLQKDLPMDDPERQLPYEFNMHITNGNRHQVWIKDDFMSATPDGEVYLFGESKDVVARGVLEAKNVGIWNGAEWKDGMPLKHQTQVQHQLMCTGYDFGILAGLIGGQKFVVRFVKRHEEFIKNLEQVCRKFWDCVEQGVEPDAVASVIDKNVLEELHPDDNGETIELFLLDEVISRLEERKALVKSLEKNIQLDQNTIRQAMGDHTFAKFSDFECTLKTQERKESVRKVDASKFRVLRVKTKKK